MNSLQQALQENPQVLVPHDGETRWSSPRGFYGPFVHVTVICALLGLAYHDSLGFMSRSWINDENYSHGLLVPAVSLFLIWKKRRNILAHTPVGMWWGSAFLLIGLALYIIGELATLYVLLHASLWCILVGLVVALFGTSATRAMAFPLAYLLTAIPLPQFLYQDLSAKLQLISSSLGVGCLQIIGVTAFRDGNVIDLGPIQLQVIDACSGLRYLFPLAAIALLCAYLFQDRMWKRVVLFLSSIPISILLNGFRIGMIGVLVERYGQASAEGFYHLFEGWFLFMVSLAILFAEMWLLRRLGSSREGALLEWSDNSGVTDTIGTTQSDGTGTYSTFRRAPYLCSLGILALMPLLAMHLHGREEVPPARQTFLDFPMTLGSWTGITLPLESRYIEVLRFDDYVLAEYSRPGLAPINLYVAYYRSQQKGRSAHSPQTCIPGGGWEITSLTTLNLTTPDHPLYRQPMNRVLIQKGDDKQLVLYWFKQRERLIANEYLVKFYLLWDALTRQRTDGALIRLTTHVESHENDMDAERRLIALAGSFTPIMSQFVPD
jgi:exosortase D (VPLPA-CTERM-specific)